MHSFNHPFLINFIHANNYKFEISYLNTINHLVNEHTVITTGDLWTSNDGFPFFCKKLIVLSKTVIHSMSPDLEFTTSELFFKSFIKRLTKQKTKNNTFSTFVFIGTDSLFTTMKYHSIFPSTIYKFSEKSLDIDSCYKLIGYSSQSQGLLTFKRFESSQTDENNYLNLISDILKNGSSRIDRTNTGTISVFGRQLRFDLKNNTIPLLTTKRVAWKTCIKELLWFMRGDTDSKILQKQGVHIWNGNTTREFLDKKGLFDYPVGVLGPGYGWQWRFFGAKYNHQFADTKSITDKDKENIGGFDQLQFILQELKENAYSRRIMLSAWNPAVFDEMALPPCHFSAQFYVDNDTHGNPTFLSCHMNMRSADVFLGLPFNIFSYSVLTCILAKKANLQAKELIISIGDAHIYKNHLDQVHLQLKRNTRCFPKIKLSETIVSKNWEDLSLDDFEIIGYYPHPKIVGIMSA
jgi:thymidylate synthase